MVMIVMMMMHEYGPGRLELISLSRAGSITAVLDRAVSADRVIFVDRGRLPIVLHNRHRSVPDNPQVSLLVHHVRPTFETQLEPLRWLHPSQLPR